MLERADFRCVCGEIFALFQACVGNFYTTPPWKVVGTLYLDNSYVTFEYFALFSVCDKFELHARLCVSGHDDLSIECYFRRSPWIHC